MINLSPKRNNLLTATQLCVHGRAGILHHGTPSLVFVSIVPSLLPYSHPFSLPVYDFINVETSSVEIPSTDTGQQ